MRVYNDAEGLEHIYYIHEDNLGSIQAITDENRNLISRYYYTPWGGRELLAGRNITDRGYTFHEHLEPFGLINMNGRVYDPVLARFLSPDPYVQAPDYTQGFNRYSYCYNNPFKYTDPDGEWVHIVIGAVVGGVINLTIKAVQGEIHNFGDGLAAFGIGAAAGAIGALTGGAAFAAAGGAAGGVGGFLAGAAGGAVGTAFSSPVLSMGNTAYFGDPMMNGKQYLMSIVGGALLGGSVNGITALANGRNFWNGSLVPKDIPVTMPTVDVNRMISQPEDASRITLKNYDSRYQDVSEIKLPDKLFHYTSEDPNSWGGIGLKKDGIQYFTTDGQLNSLNARINLALNKTPNFRIEILTSDPNFNPNNIQLIRSVTGNVNNAGGGGWEILYKGIYKPSEYYKWTITTVK